MGMTMAEPDDLKTFNAALEKALVKDNDRMRTENERLRNALKRLLASVNPGNAAQHKRDCNCVIHEARRALEQHRNDK